MKVFLFFIKILRWGTGILFLFISMGLIIEKSFVASLATLLITVFLVPLTGNFIYNKITRINLDGTHKLLRTINYADIETILPIYQQNLINHKKPLSEKQKIKLGRRIYYNTLCTALFDFHLTYSEIDKLQEIKLYFNLSDHQIFAEKRKISEQTIKNLIQKCYENNILTDAENQQITFISNFLQFPLDKTEAIKNKIAFSKFNKILIEKTSDNRLSPIQENQLVQATRDLKIDHQNIKAFISDSKIRSLIQAKLLWYLDHGIFPTIYNPPITLIRDERCYLRFNAKLVEKKLVHKGYSRSSSSVSFRVTKGVSARVGGGRYLPIKEEVTEVYPGIIFLTSSRIIFNAGGKSFQIPFERLISHNLEWGRLEFVIQNKNYLMRLDKNEAEVLAIGLSSSIRQYQNVNDYVKVQAMQEISMNESLITIS